jgi:aminocarboxymuconate-semialdehyde decarboxylase
MPRGIVDVHAHYCSPRVLGDLGQVRTHLPSGVNELDRREEWMRDRGIELQLLGPELIYAHPRLSVRDAVKRSRLLNEATAKDVRGRHAFAPLAMVPLPSGRRAAAELQHAVGELGFRGAMIPSRVRGGLAERKLDPFWECAVDLGTPIVIHSGPPVPDTRLARFGLEQQIGRVHEVTVAAVSLIFGGVLDRFPGLRLVLVMGGGSLPQLAPRLDRLHAQRPDAGPADVPSAYLRRFFYDALVLDGVRLRQLVEQVGAERVMVGTDWPFPVYDDDPAASVRRAVQSEQHRALIRSENATTAFGLARPGA